MAGIGRLTKAQEKILRELREHVTLERASFSRHPGLTAPPSDQDVDAFIKERTRLHRQTYILPLIDGLLGDCDDAVAVCRHIIRGR